MYPGYRLVLGIIGLVLTLGLPSLSNAAPHPRCLPVTGRILLVPDPDCTILHDTAAQTAFPDLTFLAELPPPSPLPPPPVCFQSSFHGQLGTEEITGAGLSGLTLNGCVPNLCPFFTAATVLEFFDQNNHALGKVFTRDAGLILTPSLTPEDTVVTEEVVIIDGTKRFTKAQGTFTVQGKEFNVSTQGATVVGTLCFP